MRELSVSFEVTGVNLDLLEESARQTLHILDADADWQYDMVVEPAMSRLGGGAPQVELWRGDVRAWQA